MIVAIAGDMIGSPYERFPIKKLDFTIRVAGFADDTESIFAFLDAEDYETAETTVRPKQFTKYEMTRCEKRKNR